MCDRIEGRAYEENGPGQRELGGAVVGALARRRRHDAVERALGVGEQARGLVTDVVSSCGGHCDRWWDGAVPELSGRKLVS